MSGAASHVLTGFQNGQTARCLVLVELKGQRPQFLACEPNTSDLLPVGALLCLLFPPALSFLVKLFLCPFLAGRQLKYSSVIGGRAREQRWERRFGCGSTGSVKSDLGNEKRLLAQKALRAASPDTLTPGQVMQWGSGEVRQMLCLGCSTTGQTLVTRTFATVPETRWHFQALYLLKKPQKYILK